MPMSGQVYICNVCDQVIRVINGSDAPPICCETEMELVTEENQISVDKNVCGAVLKCKNCNFKVIMAVDSGTGIKHCLNDMIITADRTTGEWDHIFKCTNCGQIVKITREGCGPLTCCDSEICVMDVPELNDLKEHIDLELEKVHDAPFEDPYLVCT